MALTDSNFILNGIVLTEPVFSAPGLILRPAFAFDHEVGEPESVVPERDLHMGFSIWLQGENGVTVRQTLLC